MVVTSERAEGECVGCHRREHRARSFIALDLERVAIGAAPHLELLPAAHKVVIARIERVEHADPALGLGMEHDEVAVLLGLDVDPGVVAGGELIVIEANSDGILSEQQQCKQHTFQYTVDRLNMFPASFSLKLSSTP